MPARKITENVFSVGVNDWDRKLFDELIPQEGDFNILKRFSDEVEEKINNI